MLIRLSAFVIEKRNEFTDNHVNGGVIEIESGRPVEGCSIFPLTLIILAYTTT